MPKQKLFDDESDEEVEIIKTENEYAKKYDTWREKEEIHKLEQKYGPKALTSDASSSNSEDDDEPPEVSEEMEEQFLKTLALLKTKDPRIYDPEFKAFDEKEKETVKETKKPTLTFADSDEDDEGDGNIFSIEKKAEVEQQDNDQKQERSKGGGGKEVKIKEYLTGKKEHIDSPIEKDLAPLKALWSDPNINEGEAFLRDYILNKKYLEDGDIGEAEDRLRDDDELEADEQMVEEQGKFERAYNFRFEEPDQEYLKRFPRTMNFIRPKDDKRSRKRAEIRTRKEEEKRRKMEDIARLKSLKLKEIQEKIEKIKEVTGNQELAFKEDDIEGDFDPEEHDRRMKALFDEQYYGGEEREKPVFPDLDKELEIENWDNYDPDSEKNTQQDDGDGFHCEDAEFNMDADFNPKQAQRNLLEEIQQTLGKKRRNRKKKSKLAKLLEADKPKFIPTDEDKTYAEYMEEYYKMDCEDVIGGDLPTRFKYREVVANDYGLTVEEILLADDRELTQWVPLKKIVKHRPESVQKSEINTYRQKAGDVSLKRKMLPSLFKHLPEEPELVVSQETKKKKKKNKRKQNNQVENSEETGPNDADNTEDISETVEIKKDKKKKDKKHKDAENEDSNVENNQDNVNQQVESIDNEFQSTDKKDKKKKNKKQKNIDIEHSVTEINQNSLNEQSGASDIELNTIDKDIKQKDKHKSIENYDKTQIPKVGGQTEKKNKQILTNETDTNNPTHKEHNSVSETTKQKHNSETNTQSSTETIEIKQNGGNKKKRKKNKNNGFNIEVIQNATPSKGSENTNKKRKLDNNSSAIPSKKKKNNKYKNKDNKWNKNDKFKKNQNDKSNDDPLSRLSDERLKAYGLNPKKYRSFLKYKKF